MLANMGARFDRIEMPPLLWLLEVANVPPVVVVDFIRVKPPYDAETVSRRQSAKDTQLQIVAYVPNVAVLHGQMTAGRRVNHILGVLAGAFVVPLSQKSLGFLVVAINLSVGYHHKIQEMLS